MSRLRSLSLGVALALLVGACTGSTSKRSAHSPRPSESVSSRASPSASAIRIRSLSGRIVFDNFRDIWVMNADGTGLKRLTSSPGPDFDPTWAPDGSRIAFRSERRGRSEIWVMNANGSGQRRLTTGLSPAWSPDGSMIAYADGAGGLSIMSPDGFAQRRVPGTLGGEYPSWSPDSRRIAFNSNLSGDHVMYVAAVDGSNVEDLSNAGEGWQVDWSPDGRSILFVSHRDHPDNNTDVYTMRPDGSGVKRLTHNRAYTPAWSPDGSHIVFAAPELFVMNPDGTQVTALTLPDVGEISLPDWVQ